MKVCVISDTHGQLDRVRAYLNNTHNNFDEIWHLGDFDRDAQKLEEEISTKIVSIRGNCDIKSNTDSEILLQREGHRILLCHGHLFDVKIGLTRLFLRAKEMEVDLVCFGHTHIFLNTEEEGVTFFNPGSPALPKKGDQRTIGSIELSQGSIVCNRIVL